MSGALYNENNPYAAQWLANLVGAGHIAAGDIDPRSIDELRASDLADRTQCHFFAGIGVWSHALRLAGWPDEVSVWSGSCPCQPFSQAGDRLGEADERHLWPSWFRLIDECRPAVIFGEQVASDDGLRWLDIVRADLERAGYAFGAADLCAAGVGAPHIRQRLFFVAHSSSSRGWRLAARPEGQRFADALGRRAGQLGDSSGDGDRQHPRELHRNESEHAQRGDHPPVASGAVGGFWGDAEWLACRDGVSRAVEPGTFPLAHGVAERVGQLRAYGNAIVAPLAATFIRAAALAFLEVDE